MASDETRAASNENSLRFFCGRHNCVGGRGGRSSNCESLDSLAHRHGDRDGGNKKATSGNADLIKLFDDAMEVAKVCVCVCVFVSICALLLFVVCCAGV